MNNNFKKDIYTEKELWSLANKGNPKILKDDNILYLKNNLKMTPLHYLAYSGCVQVLEHREVSQVKDYKGNTPLHYLAWTGEVKVLEHKDVLTVTNNLNRPPIYELARSNIMGILTHQNLENTILFETETPLQWLANNCPLSLNELQELFPWIVLTPQLTIKEFIHEVSDSPNSYKFIFI